MAHTQSNTHDTEASSVDIVLDYIIHISAEHFLLLVVCGRAMIKTPVETSHNAIIMYTIQPLVSGSGADRRVPRKARSSQISLSKNQDDTHSHTKNNPPMLHVIRMADYAVDSQRLTELQLACPHVLMRLCAPARQFAT